MSSESNKNPVVVRTEVQRKSNYLDYRDDLRFDFYYSCAYCTMTEAEAGGIGFQIDHYYSQKHRPDLVNEYTNLMYSCAICNRCKSGYHPEEADLSKGHVILRPDEDDPSEHLEIERYLLKSKTPTGEFNILYLDLNRALLTRLRRIRERFWNANEYIAFGIHKLARFSVDNLHPSKRFIFLRMRQRVKGRRDEIVNAMQELIREFARSPLLDEDPEKTKRLKRRKAYLRAQKVVNPDLLYADDRTEH